ncbi:MAG: hypothetical protein ACSHWU_11220 [Marinicella sp.]
MKIIPPGFCGQATERRLVEVDRHTNLNQSHLQKLEAHSTWILWLPNIAAFREQNFIDLVNVPTCN